MDAFVDFFGYLAVFCSRLFEVVQLVVELTVNAVLAHARLLLEPGDLFVVYVSVLQVLAGLLFVKAVIRVVILEQKAQIPTSHLFLILLFLQQLLPLGFCLFCELLSDFSPFSDHVKVFLGTQLILLQLLLFLELLQGLISWD